MISGLPRSGSTLLCQILNINPEFQATQTSPLIEMLNAQQSIFSHSPSFRAVDRIQYYESFTGAQKAFLSAFYEKEYIVFDKNRMWPMSLMKVDEILGHSKAKILWTYRRPAHCLASMENQHRKYPLIQYPDEPQVPMTTIDQRMNSWTGDNGIMTAPVMALNDAVNMGYGNRIHIVNYKDLCTNTQEVMNDIHEFLGLDPHEYDQHDFKDLRQTTKEHDNLYNYKFPHDILEGRIEYKEPERPIPERFMEPVKQRFNWLNTYCQQQTSARKPQKVKVL